MILRTTSTGIRRSEGAQSSVSRGTARLQPMRKATRHSYGSGNLRVATSWRERGSQHASAQPPPPKVMPAGMPRRLWC
eukprot:scaffold117552_cov69-Phaeocystis_antarctica.AAC.2